MNVMVARIGPWPGFTMMMSPLTSSAQGRFTWAPSLSVHCSTMLAASGVWRWG